MENINLKNDKQKAYNKEYYQRTKHNRRQKIECNCGKTVCAEYYVKHKATPYHKKRVNEEE